MASEHETGRAEDEEPLTLLDVAEKIGRNVSAALLIGCGFIALAIYARPGPPKYQAIASGGEIVRLDTRSGVMIACEAGQCYSVRKRGDPLAAHAPSVPPAVAKSAPASSLPAPGAPPPPSAAR